METAYNLFIYTDGTSVSALGMVAHELDGTDEDKVSALQRLVDTDYKAATQYPTRNSLTWQRYGGLQRLGMELQIFEDILREVGAPINPLVVITPILENAPRIDASVKLEPFRIKNLDGSLPEQPGKMIDYLQAYVKDNAFDLPQLINDDYFSAIKLLFNARHFVSAAKLLMSCIDTLAFIDSGDIPSSFTRWLEQYADLTSLQLTPEELWEFRNGLLHMTNLHSRAVARGTVAPLILYVGEGRHLVPPSSSTGSKYFSLKALIEAVAAGISRWIDSYNNNPDKWPDFVSRYDLTISDARVAYVSIPESPIVR